MSAYGVVLGGGGAKGGYEIGVWKALRELDIQIEMVAGTSVGALNGAIMVQDDYEAAEKLWTSMSIDDVIKVEKEIAVVDEDNKKRAAMLNTIKSAIMTGGLDVTPLKELLQEIIDEKKIRESKIDFGMVTFSLTDFKPISLYKDDMPEGKLVDYLLASACFPAFRPHEIDNKMYIDGGVANNIPISLVVDKGIKNIIVVDIAGPGISKKVNRRDLNIVYIKNSEDLGGMLSFDGEKSKVNIEIGYYDTMKAFGKLVGKNYYFTPSEDFNESKKTFIQNINIDDLKKMYGFLGLDWGAKSSSIDKLVVYKVMKTIKQYAEGKLSGNSIIPAMAEITAEQMGINRRQVYKLSGLVQEIMHNYEEIKNDSDFNEYVKDLGRHILNSNLKEFDKDIKQIIIESKFLMYYDPSFDESDEKVKRFRKFIAVAFPKICIANLFVTLLLSKNSKKLQALDSIYE